MENLASLLLQPGRRTEVVDDCVKLVDEEVARKSGLSGLAIKGAYGVVKAIKKGIIRESVDHLLDGFVKNLEPFYARHRAQANGEPFSALITREQASVADALLGFTDEKARGAHNQTMRKAYEKLRPTAKEHVQAAVPGLARLLDKHLASA